MQWTYYAVQLREINVRDLHFVLLGKNRETWVHNIQNKFNISKIGQSILGKDDAKFRIQMANYRMKLPKPFFVIQKWIRYPHEILSIQN